MQALDRELAACRAELRAVLGGLFKPSKEADHILTRKKREYKAIYSDDSHWEKFPSKNDVEWKLYDRDNHVVVSLTVTKNGVIVWVEGSSDFIPMSSVQIGSQSRSTTFRRIIPASAEDTISLGALCKRMHDYGYEWATLTRSDRVDFQEINPAHGLGFAGKPDNALYFSRLIPTESGEYVPAWYTYLTTRTGFVQPIEPYLIGNIAFARVAPGAQLLGRADIPLDNGSAQRLDWDALWRRTHAKGFEIDGPWDSHNYAIEVPMLIVWDPTALTGVSFFRRAEEPFNYINDEIRLDGVVFGTS